MSLVQKIKVIMDLFVDTSIRLDLAQTIKFLFDVYSSCRASEEEILADLKELFTAVINTAKPDLPPNERAAMVDQLAEDMINTFKLEGALKRMMTKYRVT